MVGRMRGASRSAKRPRTGAAKPVTTAIGASTSADLVGDMSRTAWR
ncbi:Uncharacterised protein [Mycobacteroides abscessus subsp. abscessus]|nr:Uncharacterised protein [Mycobacteroides abscessus subsp. abscessus]